MSSHEELIRNELKIAGVTWYGMMKFAIHYLPSVIQDDEHVCGIVYGRYRDKEGGLNFNEGMLIATDKKIIFLDHKPGFTLKDEIMYDMVAGVKKTTAIFSAVTLHTRLGDYTIRFANNKCATIFINYVEKRRLEKPTKAETSERYPSILR